MNHDCAEIGRFHDLVSSHHGGWMNEPSAARLLAVSQSFSDVLIGRRLRVTMVAGRDGHMMPLPNDPDGWVEFGKDGHFAMNDSVNISSGRYQRADGGIRLGSPVTTAVGYDRRDPARAALIDAMVAMTDPGIVVSVHVDGDTVGLVAAGHRIVCTTA
ncbi:MAG: hypothetical protein J2P17_30400 [Mycobacterium sp.]|nr:hypothetical protein [Mycobacterium sp.]